MNRDDRPPFWEASWPAQILFAIIGIAWAARQWGIWALAVIVPIGIWAEWEIHWWRKKRQNPEGGEKSSRR